MIEIKNIVKNYVAGDTTVNALRDVSIKFRESEFVSILGQSGCGKTTLLNILGGLDRYDSGDLIINGKSTKLFKDRDWDTYRNHNVGFVFQSYNLIPHLSVVENVELALTLAGLGKKERREKAIIALEKVGLKSQINKKPNQLSGGQMQRVSIARAIVNDPEIILADEPTGALDSETSVQIMDILKQLSSEHLIIMVTHNKELAEQYSTRIINLFDGKLVGDSNPCSNEQKINIEKTPEEQKQTKKEKRSAMGFFTALKLSFKNLLTKKGRTFMTSFAGSIGIIGIALVLAVSNGFTGYINKMQSDALGSHPVVISAISYDSEKFASMGSSNEEEEEEVTEDVAVPYNPMQQFIKYGHYNNFTTEFINKIKDFEKQDKQKGENSQLSVVDYNYYTPLKLVTTTNQNTYKYYKTQNNTSVLQGTTKNSIYPLLNNMDYVLEQYELIYGELPKNKPGTDYSTEMLLVVGSGNKITINILNDLGYNIIPNQDGEYDNIEFSKLREKEFKVLFNDDYYIPNSTDFDKITEFDKLNVSDQNALKTKYDNATETMKISGVIRLKENATSELLSPGVAYMPSFRDYYLKNCEQSIIGRKQRQTQASGEFFDNYVLSISEMAGILPAQGYANVTEINAFLNQSYGYTLSNEEAFELAMQQIGISKLPISISLYPKNFEGKEAIEKLVDEYNESLTNENQTIVFTDTAQFLTSTLGQMIDIISYVLVAFAGISLIVSSIMIGIITYVSVIERTKEIGVLRSIGARKKDISRVFNSETMLIGICSGTIGVLTAFILTFPISAIIKAVAGGAVTTQLAVLNPISAIVLVAISTCLTLISGLVPSSIAAKKDPVKALRTE